MKNAIFKVETNNFEHLKSIFNFFQPNTKTIGYEIKFKDNEKTLILYHSINNNNIKALPFPLDIEQSFEFVKGWLSYKFNSDENKDFIVYNEEDGNPNVLLYVYIK